MLLALRALKLGDLLVAVPALRALRRAHPDHELVLAVPAWLEPIGDLIDGADSLLPTPGLDAPLPLPHGIVDIAVNLHGNGAESRGVIRAMGARLRYAHRSTTDPDGPPWLDGMLERRRWTRLVSAFGAPGDEDETAIARPARLSPAPDAAVVHVGAFYGSRQWPIERFAEVVRALLAEGRRVVLTGGAADRRRAEAVAAAAGVPAPDVLAGCTALGEMAALVAHASIVISADTGAAHLASAYAVPSVIIFGPARPEEWGPPPGRHVVLTDASVRRGETFAEEPDPALLSVHPEQVLAAARDVLRPPADRG